MKSKAVKISKMGHYHPGKKIDNEFFDKLNIGSDADWVKDRTGIESRYSVVSKENLEELRFNRKDLKKLREDGHVLSIADIAESSFKNLTNNLEGTPPKIDAVICGTSVPDYDIPANACTISSRLGFECPSFDVNSACSSFVIDLHVATSLLKDKTYKNIAIFNPERYSLRLNYEDRNCAVLFGDGCSSAIVTNEDVGGLEVIDTLIRSDPAKFDTVKIPDNGHFEQQGHAVQKFAITKTIESTLELLERHGLGPKDLAFFSGHQANLRMVESAALRLGIPKERHLYNVDSCGNQGAAGAPSVLSMNWHKFSKGDLVLISVVGSGLTWGSALFRMT